MADFVLLKRMPVQAPVMGIESFGFTHPLPAPLRRSKCTTCRRARR